MTKKRTQSRGDVTLRAAGRTGSTASSNKPASKTVVRQLRAAAKLVRRVGLLDGLRHAEPYGAPFQGGAVCALGAFEPRGWAGDWAETRAKMALIALATELKKSAPVDGLRAAVSIIADWSNAIAKKTTPQRGAARVAGVMERLANRLEA